MKKFLCVISSMVAMSLVTLAGEATWLHDFEAAKAQAKAENKPIFINFTGSDWCGWCIKLEKEVFSKKEFQEYAKENLVLMEADFPRNKEQSAEVKAQNKALDEQFGIEGYPTLFLLDADGKKLSEDVGYRAGGPAAYVDHLKSLLKK
ncbi:thioredoxin family protein [Luteolibacter algae]|uniref:Thioredoxin family protein n=1 Tax=Luteolibacter algae TaxID=454151 RepID=A0ABW5D8R5_9BACT